MTVANAGDSILVPAVGPGSGVVVGQVFPRVAVRAVVFANRAPGTLAEVRTPALPMRPPLAYLFESMFFFGHSNVSLRVTTKAVSAAEYSPNSTPVSGNSSIA